MKRIAIVCLSGLFLAWAGVAGAVEAGGRAMYWVPNLSGEVSVDAGGLPGDTIDFVDDLGMEDENFPIIQGYVGLGSHHLELSILDMGFEGDEFVTATFNFDGKTFGGGEQVQSNLDLQMVDFTYYNDLIDFENILAGFSLGPVVQVKALTGEVAIESASIGSEKEDFTGYIPMVGLNFHLGVIADFIEVRARAVGIGYSDNSLVEGFLEVNINPFPFVDVGVGYKQIELSLDIEDVEMDAGIRGPYIMVSAGI